MALIRTSEGERIAALVFLADGTTCRCVQVPPTGTVGTLVDAMLQVQQDWEDLSRAGSRSKPAEEDSCTDDERDRYAIVEVRKAPDGLPSEKILPRSLKLMSPELRDLRSEWQRIVLRHMAARFTAGIKKSKKANRRLSVSMLSQKKKKSNVSSEYWFVTSELEQKKADVRVKFINTDDYNVVKAKEGWLDVKDKGKIKSRWVVFKENNLVYYKEADDQEPMAKFTNIDKYEMKLKKGSKESVIVKLKRGGTKLSLICENDLMAEKWHDAIRQGASGQVQKESKEPVRKGIVLKLGLEPEAIPEYTEEEELEEEGTYLSLDTFQQVTEDDGYLTTEAMQKLANDGGYMSNTELSSLLINKEGSYLTVETMQNIVKDAGYITSTEANAIMSKDGDYLTVDTMRQLCQDAGYMTTADMQSLLE
eukprot:m.161538 g.161538  ORF g.161538 m.161538 type:complete len:421 (-) comp24856_c0_seq5:25-1287(-)